MLFLFAVAFFFAISVLTLIQVILIAVKPAYQQMALRCVYGLSVVFVIVLAAYWLVHAPTTAPAVPKAHANRAIAA
jgi:hypothetical protein